MNAEQQPPELHLVDEHAHTDALCALEDALTCSGEPTRTSTLLTCASMSPRRCALGHDDAAGREIEAAVTVSPG